jgi:hypothetical protein
MHNYAVQPQLLSGFPRLSKLTRKSRLEHLRAQQMMNRLSPGDLGSMAIRFPVTVARFFVLLYGSTGPPTPHEWWNP